MRFSCPGCRSRMDVQRTFDRRTHVSCRGCKIEDVIESSANPDEAFLEFLTRYDRGLAGKTEQADGMVRTEAEIEEMIGKSSPEKVTREILASKKDYVAQYKVLRGPEPEMGRRIGDMGLDPGISEHLSELGIERLYRFQDDAISGIMSGRNVIIEAPTASGKTEAFLIPAVQRAAEGGAGVFAIFVYPTKALARDQFPKIETFAGRAGLDAGLFDGDAGEAQRRRIIGSPPQILVTNFDVIHYHLWHRTRFSGILGTARMMIVDEAHVYSGIFGTNVHYIIKRLKRMCPAGLQFVAASATLDEAKDFCQGLFGEEMELVRGSGKRGQTDFAMLFPSLRTQRALMVDLTRRLARENHKTMVFSNSHLNSELLAIQARRQRVNIKVHRAGLTADYRTSVERQFRENRLDAISCTPTLELGIDIGDVDGVISSTIPVNRLVQRIGRAARKGQRGFAFLALGNDPISQYYRNHPDDYFEDVERGYIDPKNPFVEKYQVLAMAYDRPISAGELAEHRQVIAEHVAEGNLEERGGRLIPGGERADAMLEGYSIRGIGSSVGILRGRKKVGDRVLPIALEELHKDAIYFLAGTRYRVVEFDYPRKRYARIERIPRDYPYYTRALTEEWPVREQKLEARTAGGTEVAFCRLRIEKTVYGYANIELGQETAQGEKVMLERPLEYDFVTKGIVFAAPRPDRTVQGSDDAEYVEASGYHATEHVVIEGSNMITGGVSQDLGGISLGASGLIFVYDGAIGGSGASRALYDRFERALERSMHIVKECPCTSESGCPRCTFSYRCGNNNEYLHKRSALEILERINGGQRTELRDPYPDDRPLV